MSILERASPAGHPAVAAWRECSGREIDLQHIEVLRGGKKSATYRLVGAGPCGESIIAQCSQAPRASIERTVYERILVHLPVTMPRYCGAREEDGQFVWLFFEDVGADRYQPTDSAHLALGGRWMGLMHATATDVSAAQDLPDGGPQRYLEHLRAARHIIRTNLANRALTTGDVTVLEQLVTECDRLENDWAGIERLCARVPSTLVHGDFQRKNAYIRQSVGGPELFVIDWEMAGWGVPAVDLPKIDLPTYWSVVRRYWSDVRFEDLERLAAVGRILQQLAAIHWVSPELAYDAGLYLRRPMSWLRVFQNRLAEAVTELKDLA